MDIISSLLKNKRVVYFLIFILSFPLITNLLVFSWGTTITHGTLDTWISFFATYYGAIVGGIIAGALTLIGVKMTISSTMEGVTRTIEEQKNIRNQEILTRTYMDRLNKFYGPMDALINKYQFSHGAHDFNKLDADEQIYFMEFLSANLFYSDSEVYNIALEMSWEFKSKHSDYALLNEKYRELRTIITNEIELLRKELKLPEIRF
ncbi:hypothetical protein [Peribacillus sp. JNUCC41]|uniref:hypothetical protein n=1 Tax=Peribacillus sp. JNUCC41 TaxID=2778370 RepID=UPI0017867F39|nr:hypothetical protein [Brevibacillus sp. JNUCC-41]QOS90232.1 hypothetical protein JNUCC41_00100 [Brevibacillus sp. JNUCC-41]